MCRPNIFSSSQTSSCYQYEFDQMRVAFGDLIETISPLIEADISSLKDLKGI